MDKESRQKLIAAGRQDLIDIYDLNIAGFAGMLPNGNIVDRRKNSEATIIPKNKSLNVSEPRCTKFIGKECMNGTPCTDCNHTTWI